MAYLDANDLDMSTLIDAFAPATDAGRTALHDRISKPVTDTNTILERQTVLRSIKAKCKDGATATTIKELQKKLKDTEADVVSVGAAGDDERLKDYYTQIMWSRTSMFAPLNHLGWLNEIIVFLRTIFVPGLSILLPLFILVAPLLLLTVVLKEPVTFTKYIDMIQGAIKKAVPSVLGAPRFKGVGGIAEMGEQFLHVGLAIAMLGASIWNQISSAIHMRSIVADMRRRAESVQMFTQATKELAALVDIDVECNVTWSVGALGVFGDAWNRPERITDLVAFAGHLDMLVAVATRKKTCFPQIGADDLVLKDVYHPGLTKGGRVLNSLTMDAAQRRHVLLTGPNRGGKSTLLKSVGYSVLLAQTVGVVFARRATIPVFDSIITALAPSDIVGSLSLFEAEIEFAKNVKARMAVGSTFLMMDEIFHGTNAHDGVEAAQVFLDQVYAAPATSVFSIVSTHYMDLPEKYGSTSSQNLCMDATVEPTDPDRLVYTYRLKEGVNRHSSVREILRERGLLTVR